MLILLQFVLCVSSVCSISKCSLLYICIQDCSVENTVVYLCINCFLEFGSTLIKHCISDSANTNSVHFIIIAYLCQFYLFCICLTFLLHLYCCSEHSWYSVDNTIAYLYIGSSWEFGRVFWSGIVLLIHLAVIQFILVKMFTCVLFVLYVLEVCCTFWLSTFGILLIVQLCIGLLLVKIWLDILLNIVLHIQLYVGREGPIQVKVLLLKCKFSNPN